MIDPVLALALATAAFVETYAATADATTGFTLARAGLAAATVLTLAVRRTAPTTMALGFGLGMTLESLLVEAPDEITVLVAAVVAAFSVTAYARGREGVLGLAIVSMGIAFAVALDPSDDLSNVAPTLVLFALLPGAFGFVVARRGEELSDLARRVEEAEAALDTQHRGELPAAPAATMALTDRQRDVVLLVARGFANREIAAALHLSENTIKGYVSEILAAHGLRDRTQLVIRAYESGLVRAPDPAV